MAIIVKGGGGKPEEEKTVTAGTSVIEVLPSSGKTMKKVIVSPTPTEEKTITAGTSATMVTPTSGKYINKVTVNPTPSQTKTVTPSTSHQTVSPDSGKLLSKVIVKAMEDVTPEVTAQTPMISQILSNLGFTADSASGTNKQKLQTNNANLAKISDYLPHGAYAWKKLTAQGGDFVNFVVSDQSTAYPDGGTQDGYWYETVIKDAVDLLSLVGCTKMAVDKVTFSSRRTLKAAGSISHSLGEQPKIIIVLSPYRKTTTTNNVIEMLLMHGDYTSAISYYGCQIHTTSTAGNFNATTAGLTVDTSTIISYDTLYYFEANVEYTIITAA